MPPDTAMSLVTAPTPEVLTDLPALTTLPMGAAPKGDPQPHLSFSLGTPANPFLPQFPWQDEQQSQAGAGETEADWASSQPPRCVCAHPKCFGQVTSHRPQQQPPTAPSPARPLELLNHVLGSGCGRPVLPAASTHDPLLPAAVPAVSTAGGAAAPVLLAPARAALLSPGTCSPCELRCSSELSVGLRAAGHRHLWGQGL